MKHMVIAVSNLDRLSRGLTKAMQRRRAMQQQTTQKTQAVDKTDNNSDVTTTNVTTKTLGDERYKQTMVQNMIALIHKRGKTK